MDFGLKGKVAIITGGARGIGYADACALGAEGVRIALNDLDAQAGAAAVTSLRAQGIEADCFAGDATDEATVTRIVDEIAARHGKIDILVNNAGIGVKPAYKVEDMPVDAWDRMIQAHMRSTFLWSRAVIPHMRANQFGRIVSMCSMNFTGGGRPGVSHYAAAKAGILGLTQTMAKEVADGGITANAIAPGYVQTELISQFSDAMRKVINGQNPVGRMCHPEEVAALITFLCSKQAAFINGELICMDGGRRDFYWGA